MTKIEIIQDNYEKINIIAMKCTSATDLCYKLGYTYTTSVYNKVKKFIKDTNFDKNIFMMNFKNTSECIFNNETEFKKVIYNSISYSDVLRKYNKKCGSGNFVLLKKYIEKFNVDISHFDPNKRFLNKTINIQDNKILFRKDSMTATKIIRNRILGQKLLEYKCVGDGCNITGKWLGKEIALQLDHINGINNDHRLENLRFLCPNCHSATPTWGNKRGCKNNKKIQTSKLFFLLDEKKEQFFENDLPNFKTKIEILKYFNVSDNVSHYRELKRLLDLNKEHPNVKVFLSKLKPNYQLYSIEELINKIKLSSFVKVAKELNCSDNGLRNYLKSHNIDVKNIKNI